MPYRVRSTDVWFNAPGIVAAYQPVAAPDPFAARQNVGNDARRAGVYSATAGVAPMWTGATGWSFDGSSWLDTSIIPMSNWTMLIRFSGTAGTAAVCGSRTAINNQECLLIPRGGASERIYRYGTNILIAGGGVSGGVMGFAGTKPYLNGAQDGVLTMSASISASYAIIIGGYRSGGSVTLFSSLVQGFGLYARVLSDAEVWFVSRQMAYSHVNPEWSAWGRRRRYYYAPIEVAAVRWRGIGRNNTPVSGRISTGRPI